MWAWVEEQVRLRLNLSAADQYYLMNYNVG